MTYELAKQLKDAGFPMKQQRETWCILEPTETTEGRAYAQESLQLPEGHDAFLEPTLSELIEACGDDFSSLNKTPDKFVAFKKPPKDFPLSMFSDCIASTPEEAVAKLWLALNKE